MTSILRASASAVQKEIAFISPCRKMARSNFSLACTYGKEALTGVATLCLPNSTPTSLTLKERCVKITKAPLLMLRSALLYLPLTNRVTQLALSYLSPKLSIDCIDLFSPEELSIRYSQETRIIGLKEHIQNKKPNKESITADCKKFGICDDGKVTEIHKFLLTPHIQKQLENQKKSKKEPILKLNDFTSLGFSTNEEIQPIIQELNNNNVPFKEHKSLFHNSLKSS